MDSALIKSAITSLRNTVNNYTKEFAAKLAKELNSKEGKKKEWTAEAIIAIWNTVAKELVVAKKGKKEKSEPVDPDCQCQHVYGKGDKKDEQCEDKISEKSITKKYCVRHYKQQEKDKKPKKDGEESSGDCCYLLTKGENEGEECGVKVSAKSKSGKYCSKHLKEEKGKKVNKTDLLKFIREQTKDVEDEDSDELEKAFGEVETKFGYMTLYNMETLAPKMYEKFQSTIDHLIEEGREDHEEEIKEVEEEAKVEEEEKAKKEAKAKKEKSSKKTSKKKEIEESVDEEEAEEKSKKKTSKKKEVEESVDEEEAEEKSKKTSKKKEAVDEEKPKKGSDKKVGKSGAKKAEDEIDEKPKKGSDKKSKVEKLDVEESGYENGEKLKKASPRANPKKDEEGDEVEEELKIRAKMCKEGDLKGQTYFIDDKTKTSFLINSKDRTVSGKIVDGKKIALDDADKARIEKYQLTTSE